MLAKGVLRTVSILHGYEDGSAFKHAKFTLPMSVSSPPFACCRHRICCKYNKEDKVVFGFVETEELLREIFMKRSICWRLESPCNLAIQNNQYGISTQPECRLHLIRLPLNLLHTVLKEFRRNDFCNVQGN